MKDTKSYMKVKKRRNPPQVTPHCEKCGSPLILDGVKKIVLDITGLATCQKCGPVGVV